MPYGHAKRKRVNMFIENNKNKFMAIMEDFNIDTLALSF